MYLTASDLIDMTVKQLKLLADILGEDARAFAAQRARSAQCCKDATDAIEGLIPKLIAARLTQEPAATMRVPGSANDDEL